MGFPKLTILILPILCSAPGCANRDYVTRAELRELLATPGADADLALSADRGKQIARIAAEAFTSPSSPAASAAEAMKTADQYTFRLAEAIKTVDDSLSVCVDNISNAETIAYKRVYATRSPDGTAVFRTDMEQGSLETTNRPLDLAISGAGFFRVRFRDGEAVGTAYTRNGNFFVNSEGAIVLGTGDGYPLEPPIHVAPDVTGVTVSEAGVVEATAQGSTEKSAIGQIELSLFVNPQGLKRRGGSMFLATPESGGPTSAPPGRSGAGVVLQGFLEASNVDPVTEYVRVRFLRNWRSMIMRAVDAR